MQLNFKLFFVFNLCIYIILFYVIIKNITFKGDSMKKFFLLISILFSLIYLTGCGGGGNSTQNDVTVVLDESIVLKVSTNVLKLSYLPNCDVIDGTFSILKNSEEGNVTLLDDVTGRYSYIVNIENNDSFIYNIANSNGTSSCNVEVNVTTSHIPVMTNDGTQPDFNTSSPTMINGKELVNFNSNLPVMIVDMGDKEIPDEPKIKGSVTLFEPDETNRTKLSSLPTHSGYMEIEMRGSSSQFYYPKKQYGMDTELADEEDDDISWLGMPTEHKWVLQAPYGDKSLMRNYLAYHKTREINASKYYAVRSEYVELLTRVGDQYRYDGVYVLMEKIKRDGGRLDIVKLTEEDNQPPEVTGGYILKQDGEPDPDEFSFHTTLGTEIIVYYPDIDDLTTDQMFYIESYIQQFETALKANDFNVSTSPNYYRNWIDVDSFIVHLLSRELFMDVDTWLFSEYFHKDRDKNLSMTPVWDFNAGMGNNDFRFEGRTNGWAFNILKADYPDVSLRYWMERLMSDPAFKQQVRNKWQALRGSIWSNANLATFIEQTQDTLTESAARNFERWPNVLGVDVWPNREACSDGINPIYCNTFDSAVNEHLKTWLLERADWIDKNL